MTGPHSQHRTRDCARGEARSIAWSTAPFFTRLLPYNTWTIIFYWRGLFGGAMITAIMLLLQGRSGLRDLADMGRAGWLVASLSTLAMVAFIPSLQLTDVSNVAVIIATGPLVTAAIAWVWLREAIALRAVLAILTALAGVAIIVGTARIDSDVLGIALACLTTVAIAVMTVAVRRYKNDRWLPPRPFPTSWAASSASRLPGAWPP